MKSAVDIILFVAFITGASAINILPVTDFGSPSLSSFCPQICPAVMSPVFDENGVMYSNKCKMQAAKCKQTKNGNTSPAPTNGATSSEGSSSDENSVPSIFDSFCPDACLAVMKPVYDVNGVMYTNECKMRAAKCKKKKFATVVQTPGEGSESDEDNSISNKKSARTKCTATCPDIVLPVCGSDGVKYSNPCQLELVNCKYPELNIVEDVDACSSSTK